MPTPKLVTAAKIAEVAKNLGGVYVYATAGAELLQKENASAEIAKDSFKECSCADCGTTFSAQASITPYCVTCGSEHVTAGKAITSQHIHPDSELVSVTCSACSTNSIFHHSVVTAASNKVHCAACGSPIQVAKTSVKADVEVPAVDGDADTPDVDIDDLDLVDVDGTESEEAEVEDPNAPEALDENRDGPPPVKEVAEGAGDPALDTPVDVDAVDTVEDIPQELSFLYVGDKLILAADNVIVASMTEEQARAGGYEFKTQALQQAISHTVKSVGLRKALANYGFNKQVLKFNVKAMLDKRVEEATHDQTLKVESRLESLASDFQQALDIAAAGYSRNFWKGRTNPLLAAFVAELSSMGVKNPTKIVDRIFASHGLTYTKMVLETARELSQKTVEARNELAQVLDLANFVPTVAEAESDQDDAVEDEDEDESLEEASSLSSPGKPDAIAQVLASTATTAQSTFKDPTLRRILGDRTSLFN